MAGCCNLILCVKPVYLSLCTGWWGSDSWGVRRGHSRSDRWGDPVFSPPDVQSRDSAQNFTVTDEA